MTFIRKFYEAAVAEGGGAATEVVEEVLSPAAAMAKHGTKTDENSGNQPPIDITPKLKVEETKEEKVEPTAKVEETKEPEKQSETKVEEAKVEQPKQEEKPIAKEPEKAAPTLQEVLKTEQPAAILKALGYSDEMVSLMSETKEADPKIVGIIQAYKDGTLNNYIRELATDYSKMSSEDVMRHQLRQEYPKASQAALEALFKKEVTNAYNLNSEDDEEVTEGKLLLDAKADKYRDGFIENQQKYLTPAKPQPKQDNTPSPEVVQQQREETYRSQYLDNPVAKDISATKKLSVALGENKAAVIDADIDSLIGIITNSKAYAESWDAMDSSEQFALAAFQKNPKKFLSDIVAHAKALGAKEVADPIENASPADKTKTAKSEVEPTSKAGLMAKHGTRNDGAN